MLPSSPTPLKTAMACHSVTWTAFSVEVEVGIERVRNHRSALAGDGGETLLCRRQPVHMVAHHQAGPQLTRPDDKVLVVSAALVSRRCTHAVVVGAGDPSCQIDVVSRQIHHDAHVSNPLGGILLLATSSKLVQVAEIARFDLDLQRNRRRVEVLDVADNADEPGTVEKLLLHPAGGRTVVGERLLHEHGDAVLCSDRRKPFVFRGRGS